MKKKLMIPTLALACFAMSACDLYGAGNYIQNGSPYKEGYAARIDPQLKAAAQDSVKNVIIKLGATVSVKVSYQGRSSSAKATVTGDMNVDLMNERMNGNYTVKASGSGVSESETYKFTAEKQDGYFTVTSGNYSASISGVSDLDAMYEEASYNIYSWNFSYDSQQLSETIESLQSELDSSIDVRSIYESVYSNLVYTGDFEQGNAEIGFKKAVSLNISGVKLTYNKFRVSYKECFIRSSELGIKASISESGVKVSMTMNYSNTYTYVK